MTSESKKNQIISNDTFGDLEFFRTHATNTLGIPAEHISYEYTATATEVLCQNAIAKLNSAIKDIKTIGDNNNE